MSMIETTIIIIMITIPIVLFIAAIWNTWQYIKDEIK